ncbi:hypothetical protein CDL15_Pgr020947 [Punica granatum]|uniref:Uncharacterized protein n=1 Tax=Punica granatum TaxID=22663 RepID=A0A218VS81_PUNGR|nr:hypothetical protein CDL15_Pgr020947 [Punica granatum]
MNKTRHRQDSNSSAANPEKSMNPEEWGAADTTPRWRLKRIHSEVESFEPFALANSRDKRIESARSKTPFGAA